MITFAEPLLSGTVKTEVPGVFPFGDGKKAMMFETPLTVTFPYLCSGSPFSCWTRIVVVVAVVLEIRGNVKVPPPWPPMYPMALPLEHPEHVTSIAPAVRILALASASTTVSAGANDQVPAEGLIIQLSW